MCKNNFVLISFLFLLMSCGGHQSTGAGIQNNPDPINIDVDQHIDGQYLAKLETTNFDITGRITGAFTFSRETFDDELIGDVQLNHGGAGLIHAQNLRLGNRCPTKDDDLNFDGVIDGQEGEMVYGKILIPLDGDLSTQSSHDGEFPVGDSYGDYIYSRFTKFSTFMKDLRSDDEGEGYVKLKKNEPLYIVGRVVVIHGVDSATELPETARGHNRIEVHQSLPIACGVVSKVISAPGELDDGTYED